MAALAVHPETHGDLPRPLTRLVGREQEAADLRAIMEVEGARLLTLTGPGGVGKTRLAIAVAAAVARRLPDGACFVELAAVSDPILVAAALARTLGVQAGGERPLAERLAAFLRERRLLLVLDNFEQVVEAAPLVAHLLGTCPALAVLVTSRVRLRLSGEREYAVAPLALPMNDGEADPDQVGQAGAVQLFVERARAVRSDFALTATNSSTVAEIVNRLDGLPLAIELATAWIKVLPPSALLARLERRLPMLTGGGRDVPARQQTMRETVVWSVDLLAREEQALFRRLAVFAGGFTLAAAEVVAAEPDDPGLHVLPGIAALAEKSLLREVGGPGGQPRYLMLETVREFAADELARSGERGPSARHAAYYLALATQAEDAYWGEAPGDWQAVIEPEQGNLRAASEWGTEHGDAETALRLASVLYDPLIVPGPGWLTKEHAREQGAWAQRALAMPGGSPEARVKALTASAWLTLIRQQPTEGRRLGEEAVQYARSHGDTLGIAMASYVLGVTLFHQNDVAEARSRLKDAVDRFRALDRPGRLGWALCYLASLDSRDAVDEGGNAAALERAIGYCEEALRLFQRVGQRRGEVRATHGLAYLAYKLRDLPRALASTQEILAPDWEEHRPVYHYLEDIADIAGRVGQSELAARLYGAADAQRARLGIPLEPAFSHEYERDLKISRSALGRMRFEYAWAAGRAMSLDDAVQAALRLSLSPAPLATVDPALIGGEVNLTPRERELLPLLAAGMSDAEIAAALFLSVRTIESHVHRLTAKLGVHGRAAAVEAVRAAGLLPVPTDAG